MFLSLSLSLDHNTVKKTYPKGRRRYQCIDFSIDNPGLLPIYPELNIEYKWDIGIRATTN